MMKPYWIITLVCTLSHLQDVSGRFVYEDVPYSNSDFDKYVESVIKQLHVPGLSVAIIDLKQNASNQIFAKVLTLSDPALLLILQRDLAMQSCRPRQLLLTHSITPAALPKPLLRP